MKENFRKNIIYGLLVCAVIWGLFNMKEKASEVEIERPKTITPVASTPIALKKPLLPDLQRLENEGWGTDPFRIKSFRSQGPRLSWDLSGIMYNASMHRQHPSRRSGKGPA